MEAEVEEEVEARKMEGVVAMEVEGRREELVVDPMVEGRRMGAVEVTHLGAMDRVDQMEEGAVAKVAQRANLVGTVEEEVVEMSWTPSEKLFRYL